jgi:hypothetical protein
MGDTTKVERAYFAQFRGDTEWGYADDEELAQYLGRRFYVSREGIKKKYSGFGVGHWDRVRVIVAYYGGLVLVQTADKHEATVDSKYLREVE